MQKRKTFDIDELETSIAPAGAGGAVIIEIIIIYIATDVKRN